MARRGSLGPTRNSTLLRTYSFVLRVPSKRGITASSWISSKCLYSLLYICHQCSCLVPYSMVGSTRDLNSLCLIRRPIRLLNTAKFRHHRCGYGDSDANFCFERDIFGQDCSLVEVWHYFQQLTIHGNIGTDVVSLVLNDIWTFLCWLPCCMRLHLELVGVSGLAIRCRCPHQIYVICKSEAADKPVTNWNGSVLFVEGIMCDSLGVKIEQNKRE